MSVLQKLTEGIVDRNLSRDGAALLDKWEKTGLLEGISDDQKRQGMARLLENQAKQLLKEASTLGAGDVQGFASVAFPIVRRVFGGLIANDLVSVQPMSLPSGLIFFLDFKYEGLAATTLTGLAGESVYGGGKLGSEITGGVSLTGSNAEKSFYALSNGYSSPIVDTANMDFDVAGFATNGTEAFWYTHTSSAGETTVLSGSLTLSQLTGSKAAVRTLLKHDPDLTETSYPMVIAVPRGLITLNGMEVADKNLIACEVTDDGGANGLLQLDMEWGLADAGVGSVTQIRRLTQIASDNPTGDSAVSGVRPGQTVLFVAERTHASDGGGATDGDLQIRFPHGDLFDATTAVPGGVVGNIFDLEGAADAAGANAGSEVVGDSAVEMAELNIDVSSVAVTTQTKKLKAKWTPELGQDLNAYHNLDAEVELTQLLSEHIALEIDREILADLTKGATADTMYWSRRPGRFLDRQSGDQVGGDVANESLMGGDFTGTVSEWYETLVETINDVSAQIHRKTLRGGANFLVCGPEVANLLEFTSGFRANITHDENKGDVGAVKAGSLSRKWDVYVDPYYPRNLVLVGRRGSSFLESGYVYAPYVPLQVTPTIFGTEDFVPRKGVMTRYAKKMVRPDMYGIVVVQDMNG